MNFTKHRFEIWSQTQHPYKHTLSDFAYSNPALAGVTTLEGALNWFTSVLYPQAKAPVANPAALPLAGNTINDYRVVYDDGDGKAASYRWEQREGDVTPQWYKIYDMDWGQDSILSGFLVKTQDVYVYKYGYDDTDVSGTPLTGVTGGQHIYGGATSGKHLTLHANSGDGVGAQTGYIQFADNVRPTVDDSFNLGTVAFRFVDLWLSGEANVNTMRLSTGSITDSSGQISFGSNNLLTTGNITGALLTGTTAALGSLNVSTNELTSDTGTISLVANNLVTTGDVKATTFTIESGTDSVIFSILPADGLDITPAGISNIYFNGMALMNASNVVTTDLTVNNQADIGGIRINSLITTNQTNGNVAIIADGTGIVDIQSAMQTLGITATGVVGITGQLNVDNLRLDGNVLSSQNTDGNIILTPNGAGIISVTSNILPATTATYSLGYPGSVFTDLFISGAISNGVNGITVATLFSLASINTGVAAGMTLFFNGTDWLPSFPDTEIDHSTITGLTTGDAGHTQFVMLAGRSTGQTINGGTAASESLTLDSTAHATKGSIFIGSPIKPLADASFSGSWSGTDIGGTTRNFNDVYTKGQFYGMRLQNVTSISLPTSSAQNVGRLVYTTDTKKIYVDDGSQFVVAGVGKFISDTAWNGVAITKTVTVSNIQDARNAIWQLCDNVNDFDRIYCSIKAISATQVRIETNAALPAGSYRLVGIE